MICLTSTSIRPVLPRRQLTRVTGVDVETPKRGYGVRLTGVLRIRLLAVEVCGAA